jgi:hypothetical protein
MSNRVSMSDYAGSKARGTARIFPRSGGPQEEGTGADGYPLRVGNMRLEGVSRISRLEHSRYRRHVPVVGSEDGAHKSALGADAGSVDDRRTRAAHEGDDVSDFPWVDEATDE